MLIDTPTAIPSLWACVFPPNLMRFVMPCTPEIAEVLNLTHAHIAKRGWWGGRFNGGDTHGHCLVEALNHHTPIVGFNRVMEARSYLMEHLCLTGPFASLVVWNDKPGRTKDEVLSALKEAVSN
jgi:hypothetical protein